MASAAVAIIVLILGVGLIALTWFGFYYITWEVAIPTHNLAVSWGVADVNYEASYNFLLTFSDWMPVIALLMLIISLVAYALLRWN